MGQEKQWLLPEKRTKFNAKDAAVCRRSSHRHWALQMALTPIGPCSHKGSEDVYKKCGIDSCTGCSTWHAGWALLAMSDCSLHAMSCHLVQSQRLQLGARCAGHRRGSTCAPRGLKKGSTLASHLAPAPSVAPSSRSWGNRQAVQSWVWI